MADRYWVAGSPAVWSSSNWSPYSGGSPGASVPSFDDDVYFDGNGTGNCTLDEHAEVGSLFQAAGYTGTFDAAGYDIRCGPISGSITLAGTRVDMGEGTWSIGYGDFNCVDLGTLNDDASTLSFAGTGQLLGNLNNLWNLTIWSGASVTIPAGSAATVPVVHELKVYGSISIASTRRLYVGIGGVVHLYSTGTITGDGRFHVNYPSSSSKGLLTFESGATLDVAEFWYWVGTGGLLPAGDYSAVGHMEIYNNQAAAKVLELDGDYTFGDLLVQNENAGGSLEIKNSTNDPNLELTGDFGFSEVDGTVIWTKGTGGITATGSATREWTAGGCGRLEAVEVDITGTLELAADHIEVDEFTGTAGTFEPCGYDLDCAGDMTWVSGFVVLNPGCTFDVGGDFEANGQDMSGATNTWYLNVTGSAVALGTGDVANCDASGGTEINATAGPWTDSGGNTNWDFTATTVIELPTLAVEI